MLLYFFNGEEAALTTVNVANYYKTIQCHITEEDNLEKHHREILQHHTILPLCSVRSMKFHVNIILPSTPRSSKRILPFRPFEQKF